MPMFLLKYDPIKYGKNHRPRDYNQTVRTVSTLPYLIDSYFNSIPVISQGITPLGKA